MANYDRECWWCESSKYVKATKIANVYPAPNADKLDVIEFADVDYKTVGARGLYKPGQVVIFIPGESLLPKEFAEAIGVTAYLSSGRVKTIKLRGNRSEGLICTPEQYRPFAGQILKWEDRPYVAGPASDKSRSLGGRIRAWLCPSKTPKGFIRFYDQPNIKNEPRTLKSGERVVCSEKIHGCNARFAVLKRDWKWWAKPISWLLGDLLGIAGWKSTGLFIGSHNCVLNPAVKGAWQDAYRKYLTVSNNGVEVPRIPEGFVFFGEVFGVHDGRKIQHLTYGRKEIDLRIFAAYDTIKQLYLLPSELELLCAEYALPCVKFHHMVYTDKAAIDALAGAPSEMTTEHHREGVVVCSDERRCTFAKCINFEYLCNDKRTEGH